MYLPMGSIVVWSLCYAPLGPSHLSFFWYGNGGVAVYASLTFKTANTSCEISIMSAKQF